MGRFSYRSGSNSPPGSILGAVHKHWSTGADFNYTIAISQRLCQIPEMIGEGLKAIRSPDLSLRPTISTSPHGKCVKSVRNEFTIYVYGGLWWFNARFEKGTRSRLSERKSRINRYLRITNFTALLHLSGCSLLPTTQLCAIQLEPNHEQRSRS